MAKLTPPIVDNKYAYVLEYSSYLLSISHAMKSEVRCYLMYFVFFIYILQLMFLLHNTILKNAYHCNKACSNHIVYAYIVSFMIYIYP